MQQWPETSESLIQRIQDPVDADAWTQFLAIYRPVVYRLALSRGLQHADADDLAQQVFVSISQAIDDWDPEKFGSRFRSWLYRIAQNAIINAVTRRPADQGAGSTSVQQMLSEVPQRDDDLTLEIAAEARAEAFRWAAKEIKPEFTQTTWAMFWESAVNGWSIKSVAESHNRSAGAVYAARYRVMQRIKEKVCEVSDILGERR